MHCAILMRKLIFKTQQFLLLDNQNLLRYYPRFSLFQFRRELAKKVSIEIQVFQPYVVLSRKNRGGARVYVKYLRSRFISSQQISSISCILQYLTYFWDTMCVSIFKPPAQNLYQILFYETSLSVFLSNELKSYDRHTPTQYRNEKLICRL